MSPILKELGKIVCVLFMVFTMLNSALAMQRDGDVVKGNLTNSKGKPLAFGTIAVIGTKWGTTTNGEGFFQLELEPGNYTLTFSYTGYKTRYKKIELNEQGTLINLGKINLEEIDQVIKEIVVTTNKSITHTVESDYVARLPITNIENPQVYVTVSQQLLKQQVGSNLDAALKNVPGAGVPVRYNQNRVVFLSRGFLTQPKFRNGLAAFLQTSVDPANAERIEVIKGPSATLFGSSLVSYGGLLNRVSKKPFVYQGLDINYLGGSHYLNRVTIDYNQPLSQVNNLFMRLNGTIHHENSFQDAGFQNTLAFTPSFSYQVSDQVNLLMDIEYEENKGTSPIRFNPYINSGETSSIADMGMDYKRSFASHEVAYNSSALNVFFRIDAQMSNHWKSQTALSRTHSGTDGYTTSLQGRSDTTLRAQITAGEYDYFSTDIQQNFIGIFDYIGLNHKMVLGLDYYNYVSRRNTANVYSSTVDYRGSLKDYYTTFNMAYIDDQVASASHRMQNVERNTYSAYVSDLITMNNKLSLMLSLRLDHFSDKGTYDVITGETSGKYDQTVLSPKLGVVYQLLPTKLSIFANYMNGFSNQNGTDIDGNSFKPENAIQYEGGLKADLWDKILSGSISYYHILVSDVLRDNPEDADFSIQDGEQESKGIEVQFSAQPVKGLSLLAGYAYNESKFLKADETINGLRPASSGPETIINCWLNYNFPEGFLNGFNIGVGGNYGSASFQTNTHSSRVVIPSYFTIDASIGWQKEHFRLALKLDNLTNEKYWSNRLTPQNLRRISGTIEYSF